MRIIFSRKGFDSTAGGGPSPIIDGRPVSLPIPDTKGLSRTTYGSLGLGDLTSKASRGKYGAKELCHHDPMFLDDGTVMLGQCSSSQGHLSKQGVGPGDVFLFFGLFEGDATGGKHHRIFGWMNIAAVVEVSKADELDSHVQRAISVDHPHFIGMHAGNDAVYFGLGGTASRASDALRLTVPGGPVGLWRRPPWLERGGITYFADKDENWPAPDRMYRVGNGQEFVANVGERSVPRKWLDQIIAEIKAS
ncbi:hypothetical protein IB285_01060 [Erythrobacter sp. KMU-140]|uniref:Nucleotide modification associated domain-containing protein n=2 Tax=Erythrobacter rubeus TaxID=2760803 RepID=A0ABR8KMF0_9SPHN|nr:hypothetical protein [Erythrobacter rubeus]